MVQQRAAYIAAWPLGVVLPPIVEGGIEQGFCNHELAEGLDVGLDVG